nr:hypothetical protein B0A51_03385 [Rachicladosporium sp. CCFEE 5018]
MPYVDHQTLHAEWVSNPPPPPFSPRPDPSPTIHAASPIPQHRAAALRSALASLAAAYQICLRNPPPDNTVPCELAKLGMRISSARTWEQAVRETRLGNPTGEDEKDVWRCVEVARKQLGEAGYGVGVEVRRDGEGEGGRRGAWGEVKW